MTASKIMIVAIPKMDIKTSPSVSTFHFSIEYPDRKDIIIKFFIRIGVILKLPSS